MLRSIKARLNMENVTFDLLAFYIYKTIHQNTLMRRSKRKHKKVLFIVGCQRSGTSLMTRIFMRDIRAKVYRESSKLSSQDVHRLRLNPLPAVNSTIARDNASLIILKPLVESQNVLDLLDYFPGSYALWLYRHYKDVTSSNLKAFGVDNGIRDLKPIAENDPQNWRSQKISPYTRSISMKYFDENMDPYDSGALFWFARNQLFYELNLDTNPQVLMCRYEDMATEPDNSMRQIYRMMELSYPGSQITKEIHTRSVGKGSTVLLSPEIENLCDDLLVKLEASYTAKMGHLER